MKVKADNVEGSEDFLTAGKEYEVLNSYGVGFVIIDDDGDKLVCLFEDCGHLGGRDWTVIEEETRGNKMSRKFTHPNVAGPNHKWVTREGKEVTQVTVFDVGDDKYSIVYVASGVIRTTTHEGLYYAKDESDFDLFDAPKTYERWLNVYEGGNESIHHSQQRAEQSVQRSGFLYRVHLTGVAP